jgi:hypothetical protein
MLGLARFWWHARETARWYAQCGHTDWKEEVEASDWPTGWEDCRRCGFSRQLLYEERNKARS